MIDRPITLAAAGLVVAGEHGDPFQESGFAGPVFTDDDGDGSIETQFEVVLQERKAERIGRTVVNPRRLEPDPPQVRRRHPNVALSFRTHAPAPCRLADTLPLGIRT
jgi:hypothetical protein